MTWIEHTASLLAVLAFAVALGLLLRWSDSVFAKKPAPLERLRAWQKGSVGRHYSLDGDHVTRTDRLDLGELSTDPYEPGRMVIVDSDDDPHTEDSPATFAEMVDAALARWEERYGKDGGA